MAVLGHLTRVSESKVSRPDRRYATIGQAPGNYNRVVTSLFIAPCASRSLE